jgi:Na+-transporting methylmalonyl-CoA/oxaloacetate decarboxylase gamma subunit
MGSPLSTSLIVTGIGMLMLSLALTFLYGLMYLMTAVLKDRPPRRGPAAGVEKPDEPGREDRLRAAAIAVALARAELERGAAGAPAAGETVSAWWAFHHQRQLMPRTRTRRSR